MYFFKKLVKNNLRKRYKIFVTYDRIIFGQIEHGVHKSVTKTLEGLVKGQSPPPPTDETITAVKW